MYSLPLSLMLHILQSWVVLHLQSCEIRVTLVPLCQSLYLHIAGVFNSLIVYMIHFVSNLKSQVFLFGFLWRSLTSSFILKNGKILFKIQKKNRVQMLSLLSGHPYLQQPSTQNVIQGLIGKWNDYEVVYQRKTNFLGCFSL